jgi:hypothetical protein
MKLYNEPIFFVLSGGGSTSFIMDFTSKVYKVPPYDLILLSLLHVWCCLNFGFYFYIKSV